MKARYTGTGSHEVGAALSMECGRERRGRAFLKLFIRERAKRVSANAVRDRCASGARRPLL